MWKYKMNIRLIEIKTSLICISLFSIYIYIYIQVQ